MRRPSPGPALIRPSTDLRRLGKSVTSADLHSDGANSIPGYLFDRRDVCPSFPESGHRSARTELPPIRLRGGREGVPKEAPEGPMRGGPARALRWLVWTRHL